MALFQKLLLYLALAAAPPVIQQGKITHSATKNALAELEELIRANGKQEMVYAGDHEPLARINVYTCKLGQHKISSTDYNTDLRGSSDNIIGLHDLVNVRTPEGKYVFVRRLTEIDVYFQQNGAGTPERLTEGDISKAVREALEKTREICAPQSQIN